MEITPTPKIDPDQCQNTNPRIWNTNPRIWNTDPRIWNTNPRILRLTPATPGAKSSHFWSKKLCKNDCFDRF